MKKISRYFVILFMILILSGCGTNEKKSSNEKEDNTSTNEKIVSDGVFAYGYRSSDGNNEIIKLNEDGSEEVILTTKNTYEDIIYNYNKLYLIKERNEIIDIIDLTKDKLEIEENFFTVPKEYTDKSYVGNIDIFNNKIYFRRENNKLYTFDLNSKKTEKLVEADYEINFMIDKDNNKMYVVSVDKNYIATLNEYDMNGKKIKEIDKKDPYMSNGKYIQYSGYIEIDSIRDGVMLYRKYYENNKEEVYLYKDNKSILIEKDLSSSPSEYYLVYEPFYINNKVFYNLGHSKEIDFTSSLKVYDMKENKELVKETYNGIGNFNYLGNNKLYYEETWGQDISTAGKQGYIIDIDTYEIEKTNKTYNTLTYVTMGSNTYSNTSKVKEFKPTLTEEEVTKLVKDKYTSPDNELNTAVNYITTVLDEDGNYYYAYELRNVFTGHSSFVQLVLVSCDGKKEITIVYPVDIHKNQVIMDYYSKKDFKD